MTIMVFLLPSKVDSLNFLATRLSSRCSLDELRVYKRKIVPGMTLINDNKLHTRLGKWFEPRGIISFVWRDRPGAEGYL